MVLVDSNFVSINDGCQERKSDGGVFKNCDLWEILVSGAGLPRDKAWKNFFPSHSLVLQKMPLPFSKIF